ncbi:hypothetical protein [Vibrio europaeus]|uniref:Uncharacterized protein n=1 Tax=Vibrio europaeus TaxID=300876 RepID=A0ABT5GMY5_9VIBR|nr:hypothetical protein [Vibrio europaeus]MDC5723096.1 hypothetical protein [Vibrio europaeus]MDC5728053.1 hypothetical protein [Vibrio europaeus]MDC5733356.1 hypothetical protein [Vibrio europaeus]MDC5738605.1 hypothetical protein [Vibrio europaeus]MDC5743833.1 hypothetical protein [Vibrio europaeus]
MTFGTDFEKAMAKADSDIESSFASPFKLQLKSGESLDLKAIFDSVLDIKPTSSRKSNSPILCEQGALTVLNQRVDDSLVEGATVETPIGKRTVYDVYYPDATTSILQLAIYTTPGKGANHGGFIRTG